MQNIKSYFSILITCLSVDTNTATSQKQFGRFFQPAQFNQSSADSTTAWYNTIQKSTTQPTNPAKTSTKPASDPALHLAVASNNYAAVQELLQDPNTKINQQNSIGETALHVAARHGYTNLIKLLLNYGANPNLQDNMPMWGRTPLHLAKEFKHPEAYQILLQHSLTNPSIQENLENPLKIFQTDAIFDLHQLMQTREIEMSKIKQQETAEKKEIEKKQLRLAALQDRTYPNNHPYASWTQQA